MSDPLREFRGLAIDDLDGIYLEVTHGFLVPPSARGKDVVVAAKPGQLSGNRVADKIESVLLEGYVRAARGEDETDWFAKRAQLLAVLGEAGVTTGALIVRSPDWGLATGSLATLQARVKNWVESPPLAYRDQNWSIELESIEPDGWVLTNP